MPPKFKRVAEVKEDFYKFEVEGVSFYGCLRKINLVTYKKNEPPQKEYVFQPWMDSTMSDLQMNDKAVRGTAVLDRKMGAIQVGKWAELFYKGETDKENGNRLKEFEVYKIVPIQPEREPGEEG